MKTLNFLELIQQNADVCIGLLTHGHQKLSAAKFEEIVKFAFSPEGTSRRTIEEDIAMGWNLFLLTVEGKIWCMPSGKYFKYLVGKST